MKKIFYLAIAALAFAACARELAPETESNLPKVKVSIKAILEQEDVTKAEINMSNGTASWEAGDQIAVHTKNGKLATLEAESAGTSVTFSGTVDAGDDIEDGAIAYYPAAIAIEGAANIDKISLPASYASPALSAKGFPMRGVLTGDAVEFKHIGALLKVAVNNVPSEVTDVEFTPNGTFSASGLAAVSATGPQCTFGTSAKTSVTVSTSAAERTSTQTVIYIPVPTGTLTGGFAITLKNGTSVVATKATDNDVTIARAKVVKMKAFTPEGAASEWYLAGKFNGWSTTATQMTDVIDHEGWKVARNITLPNHSESDKGFKFFKSDTSGDIWVGGDCTALHAEFSVSSDDGRNIDFDHEVSYDIYYNPSTNKSFLAHSGEPWYRTIYLMSDMELSSDNPFKLHLWVHGTENSIGTWPGHSSAGTETIAGITYYKFQYAINSGEYPEAGTYDCILHDGPAKIRYDFRDGHLVISNNDGGAYYASFTSETYNGNHGENNTNPMTQFTDPANPQGNSNWDVFFNDTPHYMQWEGSVLVCKNMVVGPSTDIGFRFIRQERFYRPTAWTSTMTVGINEEIPVVNQVAGRTSSQFKISGLSGDTPCDFYLDIFNNKAWVVSSDMVTLYFGLTDRDVDHAFLYSWGGWSTGSFPGVEMTTYETINRIKYYKTAIPASTVGDQTVHFVVSDGGHDGHWQTSDFVATIPSGSSEYYFDVSGNTITPLNGRPEKISINIDGKFSDWNNASIPSKEYSGTITSFKAFSDGNKLFIYQKYDGTKLDLTGWIYSNLLINADNDDATGESSWLGAGRDCDLEYYYYKADGGGILNDFTKIYYKTYDNTNSVWTETDFDTTKVNWKIDIDSSNNIEIEMSIPIGQLGISNNSIVRLGFIVRKPESTSQSNMLTVRIPKVTE